MKGYIVYATYRIIDDRPIIHLYGRQEDGKAFLAKIPFRPYFYIKKSDMKKANDTFAGEYEETTLKDFDENAVVKVFTKKPGDVPELRKLFEESGIVTSESDIRFVQRYYIDNNILGTIEIEGDRQESGIYDDPGIKPCNDYGIEVRTIAMDIETDMNVKKIYSISIAGDGIKEVHIVSGKKIKDAITYDDEETLLKGFINRINDIDPDIITGWNIIDFDLSVIKKRLDHHKLPFSIGRNGQEASIKLQKDFFRDSSADIPGRIVFDGIALLKQAFLSFQDYKLGTVAKEVLGEGKVELEEDFWENFEKIVIENPEQVVKYNLKDSILVLEILKKKKLIELMVKKTLITGLQLDRVKGSVAALDSLYIRKAHERGYICPNSAFGDREERIKGAYVMDPKPGIYDNVIVLDFKSLYPSIMRTYNIDPISFRKGGPIVAPNGARFADDDGILPCIIAGLAKERESAKKEKDETKSYAIKIIMNSFYGVLANPSCRFYSLDMGNAITSFARETIKKTVSLIEEKGYVVLYGDTDSVFVDTKAGSPEDAEKIGEDIAEHINSHFRDYVKRKYGRRSILELEFDKLFKVLMLPKIRGGIGGAKKRYAGLMLESGKEKISVTGMEIVRRDWTELAKKMQMELLDRVFHKKEVAAYVKKTVDDLRAGKHDELLVYRKSVRKELEEYTKTTPPHVKAARMLPKITNNIIEYYMTVNGPEPVQMRKSSIDYEHYVEKQIKPIADTILALFGQSFEDVMKNSKQKSLFEY